MAKSKQKKSARTYGAETTRLVAETHAAEAQRDANAKWWREAIESIVVAIVLALLFRTFEAEAFVIPTGSMAPTLQGRHKDLACEKCHYQYRAGASLDTERRSGLVEKTTCPMCHFTMKLDWAANYNHLSFTGDRILVNKFAYQIGDPERWDVIVFKFPGNAKQNYIKRLIGLPGETIRILHGDIYVTDKDGEAFAIAKPPHKVLAMLQPIHDTDYIPQELIDAGWPAPWQSSTGSDGWQASEDRKTYRLQGASAADSVSWLRYRHIVPSSYDWDEISRRQTPLDLDRHQGELISDFYAYNACVHDRYAGYQSSSDMDARMSGMHWVGDLAFEAEVELHGSNGEVRLDLVEGGRHFQCAIDVSDGTARLTSGPDSLSSATTKVRGPGKYRLRFANIDDQLLLWVNNRLVTFDGQKSVPYVSDSDVTPRWSENDPGDLVPVGIGAKGVELTVTRLRVLRDVYYVATRDSTGREPAVDYQLFNRWPSYSEISEMVKEVRLVLSSPQLWESTRLFGLRRHEDFSLRKDPADPARDQFFPMGDNSPQSKDARLWHSEGGSNEPRVDAAVERRLLTGKAFLIYWPHPWYAGARQLPVVPNVKRMGLIR